MKANHDKALFGICGGIAEYLSIPSLAVRLIFVFTLPMSFIIYIFLIILTLQPRSLNRLHLVGQIR